MAYNLKTAPTSEPVTLTEAKAHLQVTGDTDNTQIEAFITVARQYVEERTNRQLLTATWVLYLDCFPELPIRLEKSPVSAISEVAYIDSDGTPDTVESDDYNADLKSEPARLVPAYGESWPDTQDIQNAVQIEFTAGYSDAASVPGPIKAAMLLIIGHLYENRGDEGHRAMPKSIDLLLAPYRVFIFS